MESRGKKVALLIIGASIVVFAIILLGVGAINNQSVLWIIAKVFIILIGFIFFSIAAVAHARDIKDSKEGLRTFLIGIVIAFWASIALAITLLILGFVFLMSVWQV